MKLILVLVASILILVQGDAIKDRYESFDIQAILQNDEIMMSLINCFSEATPCSPIMQGFKDDIPTALYTACEKCPEIQRQVIRQVIRTVVKKYPEPWTYIMEKYDPENKYGDAFYEFLSRDD